MLWFLKIYLPNFLVCSVKKSLAPSNSAEWQGIERAVSCAVSRATWVGRWSEEVSPEDKDF